MIEAERIAVTGVGIVSALAPDAPATFAQLCAGARGFAPVTLFDVAQQRCQIAAQVGGLRVADVAPREQANSWSRTDALAVLAAKEALSSAGVRGSAFSLCVGGTTGGMFEAEGVLSGMQGDLAEEASARRLLSYPLSTTAERISEQLGPVQRSTTICSACSSGAVALVQGAAWLLTHRTDLVLAGGTDGLCQLTFTGFNCLGAMDQRPCRPFDVSRAGLSLGEGAGFLVLERERDARRRGARILAWLTGWAVHAEAHHITHPEPTGSVACRIIEQALARAGRSPSEVDYVNAHGTGTVHNDAMESQALKRALGAECQRVLVSSSKGQIGHTLGAAGAIEAALSVLAVNAGRVPASGGLEQPDPALGLTHVPGRSCALPIRCALSNSFGFGGTGCVLVFEHPDSDARTSRNTPNSKIVITGLASLGPNGLSEGAANAEHLAAQAPAPTGPVALLELLDPARSRRFDAASALVTASVEGALRDAQAAAQDTGLVAGTAYGNVERSVAFLKRLHERGPRFTSPADFPHLLPSAASGNASIYLGLTGPVVSVSDLATSGESACELAISFVAAGLAERVIGGAAEATDPIVARVLSPLHVGTNLPPRAEGAGFLVFESAAAARARGVRIYAQVSTWSARWGALRLPEVPPLARKRQVVLATAEPELIRALEQSSWGAAPCANIAHRVGYHEAIGAIALATAAALLFREQLDAVLVCAAAKERCYVSLLEPAPIA
jgi:3-oxoacyl-[acyl-carrier-protein] synthase II